MPHHPQQDDPRPTGEPETTLDELAKELGDPGTREAGEHRRSKNHEGEAGDALTPNEGAQEDIEGDEPST